jgi:hypothetical protein
MTPDQQQAIDLRAQGMSRADIAEHMGRSLSAVKSLLERGRAWLDADPAAQHAAEAAGSQALPHSFWVKTDNHSVYYKVPPQPQTAADLADVFRDIPAYQPVAIAPPVTGLMTVYPLVDAHFGMYAWGRETGSQDYDLSHAETDLNTAFDRLWAITPASETAVLILGGDTLHADDTRNETPQSKHKLDVDGRHYKAIETAIRAICRAIDGLAARHGRVIVRVLRGNHDPGAHLILSFALAERYRLADRITVERNPRDLFTIQHGICLVAAHHGDRAQPQRLAMAIADECPYWSMTRDRHIISGHVHHDSTKDFPGVKWWSLRAFCPPDEYGSTFGPRRALQALTFHDKNGLILHGIEGIRR